MENWLFICAVGEKRSVIATEILNEIAKRKNLPIKGNYFEGGLFKIITAHNERLIRKIFENNIIYIMEPPMAYFLSEFAKKYGVQDYSTKLKCLNISTELSEKELYETLEQKIEAELRLKKF
ncbi:MAG: hypothetical protein N3D20_00790 [Candidatus Pacearchaeota archaeon]|nr:hypothetical protein [Candidatus Pacearchaeota archaeon]